MTCSISEDLWLDYVEDELGEALMKDLELHARGCSHCQTIRGQLTSMKKQLKAAPALKMPGDDVFARLEGQIMAAIGGAGGVEKDSIYASQEVAQAVTDNVIKTDSNFWQKRFLVPAAAAAVAVFLVYGSLYKMPSFKGNIVASSSSPEEQLIVQTASNNPEYFEMVVDHQDSDDLVFDATVEKISHMSDADANSAMDSIR